MSLITDVLTIAQTISPNATVILSSKFNANYQSFITDSAKFPLIVLDNSIPKNSEIKKNNNILKDTKIILSILDLDHQDNTDSMSQSITDSMEDIADLIAVKIYQVLEVRPVTNQKYKITPLYRIFGTMLTGVALEMQVNYNNIVNF